MEATMGDPVHRLAAAAGMDAAQAREAARQDAHSPLGGTGTSAGITLSEASAEDLAALGMSADVEIPEHGPLGQPPDYRD
jgi:hypothetical protein